MIVGRHFVMPFWRHECCVVTLTLKADIYNFFKWTRDIWWPDVVHFGQECAVLARSALFPGKAFEICQCWHLTLTRQSFAGLEAQLKYRVILNSICGMPYPTIWAPNYGLGLARQCSCGFSEALQVWRPKQQIFITKCKCCKKSWWRSMSLFALFAVSQHTIYCKWISKQQKKGKTTLFMLSKCLALQPLGNQESIASVWECFRLMQRSRSSPKMQEGTRSASSFKDKSNQKFLIQNRFKAPEGSPNLRPFQVLLESEWLGKLRPSAANGRRNFMMRPFGCLGKANSSMDSVERVWVVFVTGGSTGDGRGAIARAQFTALRTSGSVSD